VAGLDRLLRNQHRERRLAGADAALEPEPAAVCQLCVDVVDVRLDGPEDRPGLRIARHVGDRRAVEADALVLRRQDRPHALRARLLDAPLATVARRNRVIVAQDPATAVADAERARARKLFDLRRHS
jgi:hypothetical protein